MYIFQIQFIPTMCHFTTNLDLDSYFIITLYIYHHIPTGVQDAMCSHWIPWHCRYVAAPILCAEVCSTWINHTFVRKAKLSHYNDRGSDENKFSDGEPINWNIQWGLYHCRGKWQNCSLLQAVERFTSLTANDLGLKTLRCPRHFCEYDPKGLFVKAPPQSINTSI